MSRKTWEALPMEQQNHIRKAVVCAVEEAMAHVGRQLDHELAPVPQEGPVTLDAEWLRGFARRYQNKRAAHGGATDYIYERAFQALDKESPR